MNWSQDEIDDAYGSTDEECQMPDERKKRREGSVSVWVKSGGSFDADPSDFDRILREWQGSGTFVEFSGFYGDRLVVLRASIEAVELDTAANVEARRLDAIENEHHDAEVRKHYASEHGWIE